MEDYQLAHLIGWKVGNLTFYSAIPFIYSGLYLRKIEKNKKLNIKWKFQKLIGLVILSFFIALVFAFVDVLLGIAVLIGLGIILQHIMIKKWSNHTTSETEQGEKN